MLNTYTNYQLIARDLPKAIDRVEKQPVVDRDTKYYLDNISKVKTIDAFVKDERLFRYAMKAHGLADMTYAKAFMVKALKEGIATENTFANRLSDKRYADFVATYNFAAKGSDATTYNPVQIDVPKNYAAQAAIAGVDPATPFVQAENAYYKQTIGSIKSIDALMANERLVTFALAAYGLDGTEANKSSLRQSLQGGVDDPSSFANQQTDKSFLAMAVVFDFEGLGEDTTTVVTAQQPTIDRYLRQTLEEDAGKQNEGVRLALYFERKAPTLTSFYEVLGDTALAKVVRTALGLPDSFAAANIDKQVQLFEDKLDIADFSDPEALGKFITRFTSLWEVGNPTASAQTSLASVLFTRPVEYGISTSTLLSIQQLRR